MLTIKVKRPLCFPKISIKSNLMTNSDLWVWFICKYYSFHKKEITLVKGFKLSFWVQTQKPVCRQQQWNDTFFPFLCVIWTAFFRYTIFSFSFGTSISAILTHLWGVAIPNKGFVGKLCAGEGRAVSQLGFLLMHRCPKRLNIEKKS